MKPFNEVERATQRKWLKQLGQAALRQYGIEDAKLRLISESCYTVFRVDTGNQRYILRIDVETPSDHWLVMQEAELLWLTALRQDTALPVPEPVIAQDGTWVQTVSTDRIPDGRIVTLLRWMPGHWIGNHPKPTVLAQMGTFMAHLHRHTERFAFPEHVVTRPHTDWKKLRYWQDPQNDTSATLTPEQRHLCTEASRRLLVEIEQVGTAADYGLIHADMTPKNCLVHQGQLRVIDFADCRFASHFYDIAVPLAYLNECQNYEALRAAFYEGYSRIRPLGRRYEAAVETFIVARAFDVIEWMHLDWPSLTYFPYGPELLSRTIQRIRHYMQ